MLLMCIFVCYKIAKMNMKGKRERRAGEGRRDRRRGREEERAGRAEKEEVMEMTMTPRAGAEHCLVLAMDSTFHTFLPRIRKHR